MRPIGLQQEPLSTSTPLSPAPSSYPLDVVSQPLKPTKDQGTLSQEAILKIKELKTLFYKYSIYSNPDAIVKCANLFLH